MVGVAIYIIFTGTFIYFAISLFTPGNFVYTKEYFLFLGPRGPLALPSVGSFVPSRPSRPQEKSGSLYTGIYALWIMRRLIKPTLWPHGIPWMPSWPPGTPWQPPQTHKQVSWPHCTLKITSTASQITFTFNPVTDIAPSRQYYSLKYGRKLMLVNQKFVSDYSVWKSWTIRNIWFWYDGKSPYMINYDGKQSYDVFPSFWF